MVALYFCRGHNWQSLDSAESVTLQMQHFSHVPDDCIRSVSCTVKPCAMCQTCIIYPINVAISIAIRFTSIHLPSDNLTELLKMAHL